MKNRLRTASRSPSADVDRLGPPAAQLVKGLRALSRQAAQLITEASKPSREGPDRGFDPRALKDTDALPPELVALYQVDRGLAAALCSLELIRRIGLRGAEASVIAHKDHPGDGKWFVQDELPALLEPAHWLEALLLASEDAYWDTQLHHAQVALDDREWQMRALAARPWSELLRCWSEGFKNAASPVDNKRAVPTWTAYLGQSAGVLAIDCVAKDRKLKFLQPTALRSRFVEEFDYWTTPVTAHTAEDTDNDLARALEKLGVTGQQHSAHEPPTRGSAFGIFEDSLGQTLTKQSRGKRRRINPAPESEVVYAWICDGLDDAHPNPRDRIFANELSEGRGLRAYYPAPPPCASWPKERTEEELRRISADDRLRLPSAATEWDRRPCIDYRSCGGVLIPAPEPFIDWVITLKVPPGASMAGILARLSRN